MGTTAVRILNHPAHGTLIIREGTDYPNFAQSNPRSACNKRRVSATVVYYRPVPGYAGPDSFDLNGIYSNGTERQRHFNITVK